MLRNLSTSIFVLAAMAQLALAKDLPEPDGKPADITKKV